MHSPKQVNKEKPYKSIESELRMYKVPDVQSDISKAITPTPTPPPPSPESDCEKPCLCFQMDKEP